MIYLSFSCLYFGYPPTSTCRECNFRFIRKYAKFQKMAEQGPMAIAMRLRNQLQSVYKLDPLRNEVSCRVLWDRLQCGRKDRAVELQQRRVVVVSAALMERRGRTQPNRCEGSRAWACVHRAGLPVALYLRGGAASLRTDDNLLFLLIFWTYIQLFHSSTGSLLVQAMREGTFRATFSALARRSNGVVFNGRTPRSCHSYTCVFS